MFGKQKQKGERGHVARTVRHSAGQVSNNRAQPERVRVPSVRVPTEAAGNMPATAGRMPAVPYSICGAKECAVPTQEFSRAHSPFSFKLHFGKRKCVFASGNDQVLVAAQNFSGLAIEIDN